MAENNKIDTNQYVLFEEAQKRIKQKRMLTFHFFVFILGCIFMYIINRILDYGIAYNWYIWGIMIWTFLFLLHVINVFIINPFMGRNWERKQRERLVELQQKKILKMEVAIEKEFQKQKENAEKELLKEQNNTSEQNKQRL
ncbi:MAG: 2TM domain-containing protein [Capnocytophaga sp.]|nr:2TM domain-containing protein [Capnocytophaga sp.]